MDLHLGKHLEKGVPGTPTILTWKQPCADVTFSYLVLETHCSRKCHQDHHLKERERGIGQRCHRWESGIQFYLHRWHWQDTRQSPPPNTGSTVPPQPHSHFDRIFSAWNLPKLLLSNTHKVTGSQRGGMMQELTGKLWTNILDAYMCKCFCINCAFVWFFSFSPRRKECSLIE